MSIFLGLLTGNYSKKLVFELQINQKIELYTMAACYFCPTATVSQVNWFNLVKFHLEELLTFVDA